MESLDIKALCGMVAGGVALGAYILYIISILRGKSRPERATWWIWTLMGLVLATSYHFSGASNTIWVPIMEFLGPFAIALLSIRYGVGGIHSKIDIICLLGACVSIALWIAFKNPIVALVTSLAVDAFALFPTLKKSYTRPQDENFWAWFGTMSADTLNLFAAERFSFAILVYPAYMLLSDVIVVCLLAWREGYKSRPEARYLRHRRHHSHH
jgi:hypothetical protein